MSIISSSCICKCWILIEHGHLVILFLSASFHARLDPLLSKLVVLFLDSGQIGIDFALEACQTDLVRLCFTLSEESNWVRQWVKLVLGPILGIAHVLDPLSKRCQISQVLLFFVRALFCGSVLAQLLDLLFVAWVLGHVADVRLDIIASLECLPGLRVLKVARQFVKPLLLVLLRLFCCGQGAKWSLACGLSALLLLLRGLFFDVHERLLESVHGRLGIDQGRVVPCHQLHHLFLTAKAASITLK